MGEGDVWVVIEHRDGELPDISRELCSQARRMKGPSSSVVGILAGKEAEVLAHGLGEYGLEKACVAEGGEWEPFIPETLVDFLSSLIRENPPPLILLGSTSFGNSIAPRLAIRHRGALVTDCIDLKRSGGGWVAVKPIQGDKINARIAAAPGKLPLLTLKPGAFAAEKKSPAKAVEVARMPYQPQREAIRTAVVGFVKADPKNIHLEEADLIVAGGKGAGDREGFTLLEELADLMEAAVAGSRPAVDLQWVPYERQIGLTGKKVSPRLLLASGISGAFEFVAGMKDAHFVVAINRDSTAPIFKVADLGIIGDHHQILPALNDALRRMKR
jgi:electron transfer flavoprotein alpha subunit